MPTKNFNWDMDGTPNNPWWSGWTELWESVDKDLYDVKRKTDAWVDVRSFMDGLSGRPTYATWDLNQTTTDVTAVIQAAINSLTTGTVIIPTGTYKITSPIDIKTGVNLIGMGMASTIISNSGVGSAIRYNGTIGSPIRKTLLSEMKIIDAGGGTDGIYMYYACQDNTVNRVWIQSSKRHGINLNESFSNVIKDCLIDSSVNDGILIDVGSNNNIIEQNHITSNDIGVFLTNANSQNVIRDNSIETNITAGIGIYRDTGTLSMISIRDNYFENDGADNIKIYSVGTAGTRMVIIDGNYFYSPSGTTNFINIDYGDDISIRDNNFGDGNVSCIHIKTSVHTGIVNLYPNVHYGTSFNNGTYLDITGTPVNWIRGIRGTPATGNIIKWNVGGYAEWVAP